MLYACKRRGKSIFELSSNLILYFHSSLVAESLAEEESEKLVADKKQKEILDGKLIHLSHLEISLLRKICFRSMIIFGF